MLRVVQAVAVSLVLVPTAGCAATANKGLVEGKWKFVADRSEEVRLRDAILFFDQYGKVTLEQPARESVWREGKGRTRTEWHYKLLSGDAADFYDLPADDASRMGLFRTSTGAHRVTIKIELTQGPKYEDRAMTLTDADGHVYRLVWAGQFWED